MGKALAFTSHTPEPLSFGEHGMSARCIRLKALLLDEIMRRSAQDYDTFYCAPTRGSDIIFGEQVLWVKATTYPAVRLVCAISYEGQTDGWPGIWRDRYFALMEQAGDVVLLSSGYTRDCDYTSNLYMVEQADTLLALCDGAKSNAADAAAYAQKLGKEVVCIHPYTLERA